MLELNEVHTFYGKSHIIHGISLFVDRGEVVCLLGRNATGKSTILKSIIGLAKPRRGIIKFKGENIVGLRPFKIARLGIGYVPQDQRIFPNLTVLDNLKMGYQQRGTKKWTIERVFELFPKLNYLQKSMAMGLSGGERQMLIIARTLMGDPELMLLDEPSGGLAPVILKEIGKLIKEIKKDMTILVTEQNVKFAIDLSSRGYILEKGKICFQGNIEEINDNQEKYLTV